MGKARLPTRSGIAELAADFLSQVPRQDEYVVWPGLGQPLRRVDRNMRAWQEYDNLLECAASTDDQDERTHRIQGNRGVLH